LLDQFAKLVAHQVQAIQLALRDVTPARPERKGTAGFDVQAASAAVVRLRALLQASDGDAGEAFLSVADALAGAAGNPRLDALRAAINEFDFENALLKLDEIAKEYGVNEGRTKS
jgi:two-component system sensor histidine kinase/response regulator